ncbi:MAG: PilZ domain-containing protein [Bdellovibrionota bacterium]|jgi:hypothetical protein|nr:PilZ domain-containing protein [Bdellovibrionota bacterium]
MKNRPLIFILIAFIHIIEPLVKVLYFKATTPFSLSTIVSNISQIHTAREFFEFWFLFPIGGLALLGVKRWSYPVFVGVQIYSIYSHMTYEKYTWPYVSEVPFVSSLILLFVNALIIVYFAFPDVRRPFFDKTMRWWETRTRYHLRIPMTFTSNNPNKLQDCEILNISQSGIFMNYKGAIDLESEIKMNISYKDYNITLLGTVKSQHAFEGERGLGIRFKFQNIWENLYMRKIVKQVSKDIAMIEKAQKKAQKMAA